jgi:hypothetical protein
MRLAGIMLLSLCGNLLAADPARLVSKNVGSGVEHYLRNDYKVPIVGYVLKFEKLENEKVSEKVFRLYSFAPTPAAAKEFGILPGVEHLLREAQPVLQRLGENTRVSLDAVLFSDNSSFGDDDRHFIPFLRGLQVGFRGALSTVRQAARTGGDSRAIAFAEQVLAEPSKIDHH